MQLSSRALDLLSENEGVSETPHFDMDQVERQARPYDSTGWTKSNELSEARHAGRS